MALERPHGRHQKEAPYGCRRSDYGCLRPAHHYAWEVVYQGWLADEAGVFESLCYYGYSCGAWGEVKDCKIFYFTYIVISFKSGVNLRTISLLFTSG